MATKAKSVPYLSNEFNPTIVHVEILEAICANLNSRQIFTEFESGGGLSIREFTQTLRWVDKDWGPDGRTVVMTEPRLMLTSYRWAVVLHFDPADPNLVDKIVDACERGS